MSAIPDLPLGANDELLRGVSAGVVLGTREPLPLGASLAMRCKPDGACAQSAADEVRVAKVEEGTRVRTLRGLASRGSWLSRLGFLGRKSATTSGVLNCVE